MKAESASAVWQGNAEVALGDLQAAQQHFQQAAEDPGLESIAYANLALVSFESGDDEAAIRAARQLLRRWFVIIFSELNRKKSKTKVSWQPPWQTCHAVLPCATLGCVGGYKTDICVSYCGCRDTFFSGHTLRP